MIIFLLFAAATAPIVPGVPTVCPAPFHYDGDDIHCGSPAWQALADHHGMRLHAIDAPELDCAWRHGKSCSTDGGLEARDYLRHLTANRRVTCTWTGDRTGPHTGNRPVVECSAIGVGDLGCAQLAAHHARYEAYFDADGAYLRRCSMAPRKG